MTARHRSPRPHGPRTPASLPAWAALCFLASGAAGLMYEVAWAKQLSYVLGNSLQAVATVTAAFLGGLALGARFLGPLLGRRGDGARMYAALELGIAVLGVISLPVLRGLDPLVGAFYRSLGGEGAAFALARLVMLLILLAPPAALMGATLPVLVATFERDRVGPALARLYALNTFGAVVGTVAGGLLLMPALGLTATTWIAAGLNLGAAFLAWSARGREGRVAQAAPASDPSEGLEGKARLVFALLFMLSGFTALAFQIVWVRIFTLVLGSSVYSFSAVLGVYLLGLALGSALVAPFLRRGVPLVGFGLLQLALAAIAAFQLVAFSRLPQWIYELAARASTSWSRLFAGEIALLAAFLLLPCILLGAGFPIAARLLQRRDSALATGLAYAVNTLGTVAGSLVAGFLAIPFLGVQNTHVLALCLAAAIGAGAFALAVARGETRLRELSVAVATCAAVVTLAVLAPRWDPSLMSAGLYRPIQAHNLRRSGGTEPGRDANVKQAVRAERVLYYREGINGSVLVGTDEEQDQRWLRVGGKIDASTGKDMETQVMLGLIPAACADSGARTLVIGLGAGFTVASALAAGAGTTEVVELEPRVVEASRYFHAAGDHPLDDPRVRLVLGDARTHLAHGRGRYGLVVSEPSNPWIAGVNNLFTVDFYRLVRRHLEPRGVFCQWVQLYELSPPTLASLLASFLDVFPEGHAYTIGRDLMLVASPPGGRLALERLRSPEALRALRRARVSSPEAVAGYWAGSLASLRGTAAGAPLNRDDLPIVEYRAPRDLVNVGIAAAFVHPLATGMVEFSETLPEGRMFSAWSREGWLEARGRMFIEQDDLERAEVTVGAARSGGFGALADRLDRSIDTGARRREALGEAERARALLDAGRETEGMEALLRAATLDSTNARVWLWIADRRRLAKDFKGAAEDVKRGLAASSDAGTLAEASLILGMLEVDRSQPLVAAERFREAQRWNPKRAEGYLYEAAARAAGGDPAGARQAIHRGLRRLPGQADLTEMLTSIAEAP